MSKTRSPNYPSLDLGAALAAMQPVLKAENRNKMGKMTLAKHLGYNSLNGRALAKIGAVRAYGLIEGMGDEVRVSEDAVEALMAPPGSPDRRAALERCALKSTLFKDIRKDFPKDLPSETNLQYWLVKNSFTQDAAARAAKNYLATMRLVTEGGATYTPGDDSDLEDEEDVDLNAEAAPTASRREPPPRGGNEALPPPGMRKAVWPIPEGDVVLMFPADLSAQGFDDLKDVVDMFIKQQKRDHDRKAKENFQKMEDWIAGEKAPKDD